MSIWDKGLVDTQTNNEYPVSLPGTYQFEVMNSIAKEYNPKPGGKIEKCAQLNIRLRVEGLDENGKAIDVTVFDNLFSAESTSWKMVAFAKAIGIYHPGMTPKELHDNCVGEIGTVDIKVGKDLKGFKRNEVVAYIPKKVENEELPF